MLMMSVLKMFILLRIQKPNCTNNHNPLSALSEINILETFSKNIRKHTSCVITETERAYK